MSKDNTGALLLVAAALSPLAIIAWRTWRRDIATLALDGDAPPLSDTTDLEPHVSEPPAQGAPARPPLGRRLTRSTARPDGSVSPSDDELLAAARLIISGITLDELAAARLIASERGTMGTTAEWCCIVDAELNRAQRAGMTLYRSLTRGAGFGRQGLAKRPASTRQDGYEGHLAAARAVLGGEARGIARGAVRFFDAVDANAAHAAWRKDPAHHARACDALTLLKRWSFGLAFRTPDTCELADKVGADNELQRWVGDIAGVNASRVLLFAPATSADAAHLAAYNQARALLERMVAS